MTRQLFAAADIRRLARDLKSDLLVLGHDDLITPEASDLAKELGVRLVRDAAPDTGKQPPTPARAFGVLPPLKSVRGVNVILDAFGGDLATPGTNVRLKDVVTSADGSPMAAGYMTLDKGEFPWTLTYDEVDIVLEGELVITRGSEVARGGPGDCIFIPKGSGITFGTPSRARFVYVAFPADWNSQ
ncbi:MAG: cupin domain-containing protein [Chloroflexota bacterium]